MGGTRMLRTIGFLFLLVASPAFAQQRLTSIESIRQALVDAIFLSVDRRGSPGCALSIMRSGEIVYKQGYGEANLEYDIPIEPSSIFHVASVSKQFTALAVALLAAEGKLSWDDDIRSYVPEVPDYGVPITLRHLAHHTSGLRDQWELLIMAGWRWEADVVLQDDVLDIVSRQKKLNFLPGDEYLYSNTGYTLLAVVVERVTGMKLREFAKRRIFEPLRMHDTHFHDDHQMIVKNRAYAYAPDSVRRLRTSIPDFAIVGTSSLFTTVEDLARWDRNFYTGQVGGPEVLRAMQTRGTLNGGAEIDYALGLEHGTYRGLRTIGHSGADAGYRSYFVRFPDHDFSVAVLCNYPSSAPSRKAQEVADIYLADFLPRAAGAGRQTDEERAQIPEGRLRQLEGFYIASHTDMPIQIRLRAGRLLIGRLDPRELIPLDADRFLDRAAEIEIRFETTTLAGEKVLRVSHPTFERVYTRAQPPDTSPAALEEVVGVYHSDELGADYELRLERGEATLWNRKHGRIALTATHRDGFSTQSYSLTFARDSLGRVDGFTISSPRVRKVRFDKTR